MICGGSRLSRLSPAFDSSSSSFASLRLCAAKASRGDSEGGMSPAKCCNLSPDGLGLDDPRVAEGLLDLGSKSMNVGLGGLNGSISAGGGGDDATTSCRPSVICEITMLEGRYKV